MAYIIDRVSNVVCRKSCKRPRAAAAACLLEQQLQDMQARAQQLLVLQPSYCAVLAHQELAQQGVAAGPSPMFPMEKLVEGYRHNFGCEPDLPLVGCMSMRQLLLIKDFAEHIKVMQQPIRDSRGRPHTMVQPLKRYADLDTLQLLRQSKMELLATLDQQLLQQQRQQQQQQQTPAASSSSSSNSQLQEQCSRSRSSSSSSSRSPNSSSQ
ncbi:hypothetical protein COO60DRAFT_1642235 [Scenedesmus sp. NREL 46B-D3]|nr:hypothetical protein COO60DRAFT_1642235 [Scenedesmus sp. NREL 46B-D3]